VPHVPDNPKLFVVCSAICCALVFSQGCQRRAYNDLYAENMAGEIRELEDRIYEYDSAYQGIEEELAVLQSENARLHEKLMAIESSPTKTSAGGRSLFKGFQGSSAEQNSSGPKSFPPSSSESSNSSFPLIPTPDPVSNGPPSIPSKSSSGPKTPSVDSMLPPPITKPSESKAKAKSDLDGLKEPKVEMPPSGSPTLPRSDIPKFNSPLPLESGNESILPVPAPAKDKMVPPPLTSLPSMNDASSIEDGRIDLPASIQAASFVQTPKSLPSNKVQDAKVIEIAFHPTLCRGQNLDSKDGEDGLYLVFQPRNAIGETIDKPATLTIVALDPNRPEQQSKIGRWAFTPEEVEAMLEPVGISHGYHIPMQWQEAKPLGDAVQIFVRYEMADGRRLVNERRVQLHISTTGSATWTPRAAR